MYRVSPSGIGLLLECPRCFWLYANEGLRRPDSIFSSLPDGMDKVFKDYFDLYREKGELPPEISDKVEGKLFDNLELLKKWRNINFGKGGLKANFPEYNILLQGAIDEVLVSPKGQYIPFDFKTRGYPTKKDTHEHYRNQLDLYTLLFEKNNLSPAPIGYLLFFWPVSYKSGTSRFKTELIKLEVSPKNGLRILKRAHDIASGPIPKAHTSCKYCMYREGA